MSRLPLSLFIGSALLLAIFVGLLAGSDGRGGVDDLPRAQIAQIEGYGAIRIYRDADLEEVPADASNWAPATKRGGLDFLMLSGGGAGGAFSVGILSAWSAAKTRPQFDVVTGVSTGALIAPFAFLGSAHDDTLVHLFTSGVAENLVSTKFPVGLIGSSLLRSKPLRQLVEASITQELLGQIANEHRKGRRLLVLTTNLDTQRGVVWNLGAVAGSGRADALKLFQDVVIASASIPGVYPAVMINTGSDERQFVEMHSDGGSISQVLMLPSEILRSANSMISTRRPNVNFYVIVNNALVPEYAITRNNTLPVIARAYAVLLKSQTQSELTILYDFTKLSGAKFHLATIDIHVPYSMLDPFNASYMRTVFDLGYSGMAAGKLWKDRPVFR